MSVLVDQAVIFVRAGKGGDGAVSFRREKYVPKGGPDGGNGGDGGDVVLIGDPQMDTLIGFTQRPHHRAKNGQPGLGKNMHGAGGDDCLVRVPLGTLVYDEENGELIADVSEVDQRAVVAKGGAGGLGNDHFKSATNQTPRESTPGEPGEEKTLRLELKLIADVGLIGLPNAGKSTLLRAISRATPKVADYPFTTLEPGLGIAELTDERRLVVADIPGLVEGVAQGAGLGHDFLRHIERTQILVHLIDLLPIDGSDPVRNYEIIRKELFEYSVPLAEKPELIVFNKIDLIPDTVERNDKVQKFLARAGLPKDEPVHLISAASRLGTPELLEACWKVLGKRKEAGWRAPALPSSTREPKAAEDS